jgi:hypothetical protein
MMAFWKEHCPSIPILTIQELLADLSFFWRERERRRLAQMKTFHGKRVMELKRQLTHRQPYGQVVTKAMKFLQIPSQILSIPELDVVIEFQNLRARNEHPTDDDPIL